MDATLRTHGARVPSPIRHNLLHRDAGRVFCIYLELKAVSRSPPFISLRGTLKAPSGVDEMLQVWKRLPDILSITHKYEHEAAERKIPTCCSFRAATYDSSSITD